VAGNASTGEAGTVACAPTVVSSPSGVAATLVPAAASVGAWLDAAGEGAGFMGRDCRSRAAVR
jgi:hypothetical protein